MNTPVLSKVTMYPCPECGCLYNEPENARNCCWHQGFTETVQYKCCECGTVWDEADDARGCCSDEVEVTIPCPKCGLEFEGCDIDTLKEAQRCCQDPETSEWFECKQCNTMYEDNEAADNCCIVVAEITPYACGACGGKYEHKSDAAACC